MSNQYQEKNFENRILNSEDDYINITKKPISENAITHEKLVIKNNINKKRNFPGNVIIEIEDRSR